MTTLAAICRPDAPPERLRDLARAADDSGLDELWLWEDCFWGGAGADDPDPVAFVRFAAEKVRPLLSNDPV